MAVGTSADNSSKCARLMGRLGWQLVGRPRNATEVTFLGDRYGEDLSAPRQPGLGSTREEPDLTPWEPRRLRKDGLSIICLCVT
ncbi:hypothetical protein PENSUB_5000 [Penicillium subrubescens]|uniref:Uncharacterized protein n=1 Tax=Penicillium subrubescens TaxID=1316194 RepID=A0A1Q5UAW9_9EURO|nr:hypothetical protein PENSUB_5000 [Penicillium subrubescens]